MSTILEYCSDLPTRSYNKGDTILKQGGKDGEILILKSGSLEIKVDDSTITTINNAGSVLGEIALLLDRGHSASVISLKDSEVYVIEDAAEALADHPEINTEISRALARRLTRASDSVASLTKQVEFDRDLGDFEMMMLWEEDDL